MIGGCYDQACALGLCAIAFIATTAFPDSSAAEEKSLKDQLIGTWMYVGIRFGTTFICNIAPAIRFSEVI